MKTASPWEKQTYDLIRRIEEEIEKIQRDAKNQITLLNSKKTALEESLTTYREMMNLREVSDTQILTIEDTRNKSQREILILIAERNNGLLIANQAVKLMKEAKKFSNPKNANAAVYSTIARSKEFEYVKPGVFRLQSFQTGEDLNPKNPIISGVDITSGLDEKNGTIQKSNGKRTVSGVRDAVKKIREANPIITKMEITAILKNQGFDFKGKKPTQAVNMAWAYLEHLKKAKLQPALLTLEGDKK